MTYQEFRKAYPAQRFFQQYDQSTRGHLRNVSRRARQAKYSDGRFVYVHQMLPGVGFGSAAAATARAYAAFLSECRVASVVEQPRLRIADDGAAEVEATATEEASLAQAL